MSPKGIPAVGPEQTGRKSKNKNEQFISIKREEKEKLKLGEVEEDVVFINYLFNIFSFTTFFSLLLY